MFSAAGFTEDCTQLPHPAGDEASGVMPGQSGKTLIEHQRAPRNIGTRSSPR